MVLSIVIGPMYSGKSTYLLDKINISNQNNENILVINHKIDTRYNKDKITNHNNISTGCISFTNLNQIYKYCDEKTINIKNIEHIYIDEAQFFPDLEEIVSNLLNAYSKLKITCVGLDGDYQQNVFNDGQLLKLISKAEIVTKLSSKCYMCEENAFFTKRTSNDKIQIIVGSKDIYVPSCYIHK
jgi:thymidine kinase